MNYKVLDIEAIGRPWDGKLICVGWGDRALAPPRSGDGGRFDLDWLKMTAELADPAITKVVFTLFDHRWLRLAGFDLRGPIIDVQAMAWVIDENTDLDLATVSRLYAKAEVKTQRIRQRAGVVVFLCDDGTEVPLEDAPIDQVLAYNEQDLRSTDVAFRALLARIRAYGEGLDEFWADDVLPLTPVLLDMMVRGLPVDVDAARGLRDQLAGEIADLDAELHATAGLPDEFNLASSDQLADYLYSRVFNFRATLRMTEAQREELRAIPRSHRVDYARSSGFGLPDDFDLGAVGQRYFHGTRALQGRGLKVHKHTASGKKSTDAKTLKVHFGNDPWVARYLELAKRRTIVNTFLDGIEEHAHEGRLFGQFKQTGTVTGRLSSSNPNLQNQPSRGDLGRAVRGLFRPPAGSLFVHGDYGQLEPRLMAHLSEDPVLLDIFRSGEDIYIRTAVEVFKVPVEHDDPRRAMMKEFVLALGYGAGATTLRERLAIQGFPMPLVEVSDILERLRTVYAVFFEWKESVISDAQVVGYVDTLGGHRRRVPLGRMQSWRALEGRSGRQAANSAVQGTAAEIVGRTMVNVATAFPHLGLVAAVHDELLWEVEERLLEYGTLAGVEALATMGHGFDLKVPLEFKPRVIPTWAEGKE